MKGRIIVPLACIFLAATALPLVDISRETKTPRRQLMQLDPKTVEPKRGVIPRPFMHADVNTNDGMKDVDHPSEPVQTNVSAPEQPVMSVTKDAGSVASHSTSDENVCDTYDPIIYNAEERCAKIDCVGDARTCAPVTKGDTERCALLFYGLPRNFKDQILPSTQTNIIAQNLTCDVFLSSANRSKLVNMRNRENTAIAPEDVCGLTDHVGFFTPDEFHHAHPTLNLESLFSLTEGDHILRHGCEFAIDQLRACKDSLSDSTKCQKVMQWFDAQIRLFFQCHSIEMAWAMMHQHAQRHEQELGLNEGSFYKRVGFFRNNVLCVSPVDITNSDAAIPPFAEWGGSNDRMFYGLHKCASSLAKRFEFVDMHMKKHPNSTFHSESVTKRLMKDYPECCAQHDVSNE